MKRFSDLGNYLSERSKYANIEMTMITNMGRTIMCIFFFLMDFFFLVKLTMPWLDRKISQNHDKPEIYKT